MKKYIIIAAVVIILLVAGFLLWRGGFLNTKVATNEEINNQTAEKIENFGKITDDIYVEMLVQVMNYQAEKNPTTYALNMKNLYEKYGVTEERMKAYSAELEKDPIRAQIIIQKYTQRLTELQNESN